MKNILLATTGLFGAALLATSASAQAPKVTIGGFADFQAGFVDDDNDANTRDQGFRNDTEISIQVSGKTDGGLGYGAVIDLEADVTDDKDNEGSNASRTFIYLEGDWGRTELGSNRGAAASQRIDASSIASATGGINGAWTQFTNGTAGTEAFITKSKAATEHGSLEVPGDESTYNATKITYYSPRFSGFQFGVSYTPDLNDRGQFANRVENSDNSVADNRDPGFVNYGDVLEAGLTFEHQLDGGVDIALSVTGETAEADNATSGIEREDITAYAVGGLVSYQNWSLAASYADWDDSFADLSGTTGSVDESEMFTIGAAYDGGSFSVSATYLNSTVDLVGGGENEFDNFVVGADYKLAPGITPYAEVSFYEFDADDNANDNDGTLFILGTQIAF